MTGFLLALRGINVDIDDPMLIGCGPAQLVPAEYRDVESMRDFYMSGVRQWWLDPTDTNAVDRTFGALVIAVCTNGEVIEMAPQFRGDDDKAAFAEAARQAFARWKVQRYCVIAEAWSAPASGETLPPSQCSNRKEVMMITAVDADQSNASAVMELVRDWGTGCVVDLRNEGSEERDELPEGWLTNLLQESSPAPTRTTGVAALVTTMITVNSCLGEIEAAHGGFGIESAGIHRQSAEITAALQNALDDIDTADPEDVPSVSSDFLAVLYEARDFLNGLSARLHPEGETGTSRSDMLRSRSKSLH